jgi:hypothetical protein
MIKSKINETIDLIGDLDFNIRWVQRKIAQKNYSTFKCIQHQELIQQMVLKRLKERYNKAVGQLLIY